MYRCGTSGYRYCGSMFGHSYSPCYGMGKLLMQTNSKKIPNLSEAYAVIFVTAPTAEIAKTLGRNMVSLKMAACINIVPNITSIYQWKGELAEDSEVLMMIKTRTSKVSVISDFVANNHPYEVCEVISLPIVNGNPKYLKWLNETIET